MIPADLDAEATLLGSVIRKPGTMDTLWGRVDCTWFHRPAHAALWATFETLWAEGRGVGYAGKFEAWDHFAVRDEMLKTVTGLTPETFDKFVNELRDTLPVGLTGVTGTLERMAFRRRLLSTASELTDLAASDADLEALASDAETRCAGLDVEPAVDAGVWLPDFIGQSDSDDPWAIPGLLRRGWRAIIVATEGGGKSTLLRQLAVGAARGIHPLRFTPIPPQRVLFVDAENPLGVLRRSMRQLWEIPCASTESFPPRLLPVPAGLNLRKPRDRAMLEAEMRKTKPDLLVLGPLYKLYSREAKETDEQAAMATQAIIDRLRVRYGCAVLIEHHAPHGDSWKRDMRPFGSSAWLRWPELGIGMEPCKDREGSMTLARWRGDRMSNSWPARIDRDQVWPWSGYWPDGADRDQ